MIEDLMDPNVQHGELGLMFTTLKVGAAQQIITIRHGPFCSRDNIIIVCPYPLSSPLSVLQACYIQIQQEPTT